MALMDILLILKSFGQLFAFLEDNKTLARQGVLQTWASEGVVP